MTSSVPDFAAALNVNGGGGVNDVNVDVDDNQLSDDIAQDEYGFAYFNHNTSSENLRSGSCGKGTFRSITYQQNLPFKSKT